MADSLFTEGMGRGAYLLPFLEGKELHAVSAVSRNTHKSFERHSHLLFPPVQGTSIQPYTGPSYYLHDDHFGDQFYLRVNDLKPYSKNGYSMTFWDIMDLLNKETIVQTWFIGYNTSKKIRLVDVVPDIIDKYDKDPKGIKITLTSKDNEMSVEWYFKKVLLPSPFLSRRKSPKSLKRSSKSAQKRRKNKSKSKSKNKRSVKPRRR
jgi:hypothetical protein